MLKLPIMSANDSGARIERVEMMHRSSGELSSGLQGAETPRALALEEASSAPTVSARTLLRHHLAVPRRVHSYSVSSQGLVYASCIGCADKGWNCWTVKWLHLGGGLSGWGMNGV